MGGAPGTSDLKELEPGGYCLRFGVVLHDLLAHLTAPAGLLISAERPCRVAIVMGVDADCASLNLAGHPMRHLQILRPYACLQAVCRVVGKFRHVIQIVVIK